MTVFLLEQNAFAALKIADYAYVLETRKVVLQGTGVNDIRGQVSTFDITFLAILLDVSYVKC